ncbi:AAA family ATPase [Bradyrhizobium sp. 26S5]|uniref:AAA family ATPase n=1 Tax=Bradyrhizobium sp. 26S5 TaxID=3139729 RepID=UPI0030CB9731
MLRLAEPNASPQQWQQLVDDVHAMGERHGLPVAVVQNLMAAATEAPPDRQAGEAPAAWEDEVPQAVLVTPAHWPHEPPPPVDWLADHRIPRGDVTTLHGDGGAGKTDIATQLAEGCARGGGYWLGHEISHGPVVIISAEEPERELRRRMWLHGQRDGFTTADIADVHLWFPDDVAGAVFATPSRSGLMVPTPLFRSIEAAVARIAPVLVVVDNVAATFTGNQNDRVMVRSYVNLWRTIARQPSRPAVLLLDHPSLSGLTNGSGRGGNMDWRNAVRSALYLRVPEDKAEADSGVRVLETQKSNYGPTGEPVRLQWGDGGLALEKAPNSLVRLAEDAKVDEVFLRLLDKRNAQGRPVRPSRGPGYAPSEFAEDPEAAGSTAKAFAISMDRLYNAGKIITKESGPASRRFKHIERAP